MRIRTVRNFRSRYGNNQHAKIADLFRHGVRHGSPDESGQYDVDPAVKEHSLQLKIILNFVGTSVYGICYTYHKKILYSPHVNFSIQKRNRFKNCLSKR